MRNAHEEVTIFSEKRVSKKKSIYKETTIRPNLIRYGRCGL